MPPKYMALYGTVPPFQDPEIPIEFWIILIATSHHMIRLERCYRDLGMPLCRYAAMPWDAVQICQASCPRATRCFRRVAVAHLPRQGSTTCLWWWTSPENLSLVHFTWFVVTCAVISYDFMWFHELHRHLSTKSKAHQAAMGPQHLNGQTHSENSHGWTSLTCW